MVFLLYCLFFTIQATILAGFVIVSVERCLSAAICWCWEQEGGCGCRRKTLARINEIVQPSGPVNKGQENITHRGRGDFSRCHDAVSSVQSKIRFS